MCARAFTFADKHKEDRFNFDGEGGILGHAFPPSVTNSLGGDTHFDDSEYWTKGSGQSERFFFLSDNFDGTSEVLRNLKYNFTHVFPLHFRLLLYFSERNHSAALSPHTYRAVGRRVAFNRKNYEHFWNSSRRFV